ncbi:MAG: ABC transporter ATP-binding protein [Salinarimonas sp.]|nr:ABC transporter ATP-binding protein [Salinarimonas sp.]
MADTFRKLWQLLTIRERKQGGFLLLAMLFLGVIEMVGVASIMPLIAILSNPDLISTNAILARLYDTLGFQSTNAFLIALTIGVFILIALRTCATLIVNYGLLHYAQIRGHTLSVRLLGSYLRRPYAYFLNRHSADLGKSVLSEVEQVVSGSLIPALQLISKSLIAAFLIALVVAVEPVVAVVAFLVLAVSYGGIYVSIRAYLHRKGQERVAVNGARYQLAQEVLGGVKEVKVGGHEKVYLRRFDKASGRFALLKVYLQLVKQVPKYALELIAFGGILTLVMVLLFRADGRLDAALPVIALYAFAGMRLIPAIQAIYKSLVAIRFGAPALDNLHRDLLEAPETAEPAPVPPLPVHNEIRLDRIAYAYPKAQRTALRGVSLSIPAGTSAAFVGATGAGKSTVVDVILGLLQPQEGHVLVDGAAITPDNVRAWQRTLGYVPQQIYLIDESVAANIAFGVAPEKIDMQAVERAARMANLHDFVTGELPEGYETQIGDRGVRLSGGQRQRIGIARALYHDPHVLIMDEATSALDNLTEQAVMDAVYNLGNAKTIILIAHRLSTVRNCDRIFLLDGGEVVAEGTFDELTEGNERFRAMAGVGLTREGFGCGD